MYIYGRYYVYFCWVGGNRKNQNKVGTKLKKVEHMEELVVVKYFFPLLLHELEVFAWKMKGKILINRPLEYRIVIIRCIEERKLLF